MVEARETLRQWNDQKAGGMVDDGVFVFRGERCFEAVSFCVFSHGYRFGRSKQCAEGKAFERNMPGLQVVTELEIPCRMRSQLVFEEVTYTDFKGGSRLPSPDSGRSYPAVAAEVRGLGCRIGDGR